VNRVDHKGITEANLSTLESTFITSEYLNVGWINWIDQAE